MAAFLNWRYNMFFKSPLGSGLLMWIIPGLVGGNSFSMVHRFRPLRIRVGLDLQMARIGTILQVPSLFHAMLGVRWISLEFFNAYYFGGCFLVLLVSGRGIWMHLNCCWVVESQKWQCLCFLYVLFWAKTSSFRFYTKKHQPESRRPFLCVFFQEPEPVFGRLRMKNEALQVPATNLLSREICSCFGNFAHPGNKNHQESLPLK